MNLCANSLLALFAVSAFFSPAAAQCTNPPPPTTVQASWGTLCGTRVDWSAVECATSYNVWRADYNDPRLAQYITNTTETTYTDTSLAPFDAEYYWVRSVSGVREGQFGAFGRGMPGGPPSVNGLSDNWVVQGDTLMWDSGQSYSGPGTLRFRWTKDGLPLSDDGRITGSNAMWLSIHDAQYTDAGRYRVFVANDCGETAGTEAELSVLDEPPPPTCPDFIADYNQDGGVDGSDVEAFFLDWQVSAPCADANQDGGVDGGDVEAFFNCWEAC